ncbi:DUF4864 domain-containing protein [Rhizobium sp. CFBP 8762]|uniref:DUF4864 domain-containing protein n=1 Tax=Rhizobium sp. CFBP 8762 TaxID=2775279 RepID=UPI00177F7008|nr:DUF4864 domain-containing protein [Rhizobium sp. CFBP 8762]MBD8554601.1 DUF4864 domain-containing protein [Rhizobium sp. CFBP 8762]
MRSLEQFCAALIVPAVLVTTPLRAEDAVKMAQKVIESQIAAFLNEDADAAYERASPAIKKKFPDKAVFFEMVRRDYTAVYQPGNFTFGTSQVDGDVVLQEVRISAPDGQEWVAVYQLVKEGNQPFTINGVRMMKAQGTAL